MTIIEIITETYIPDCAIIRFKPIAFIILDLPTALQPYNNIPLIVPSLPKQTSFGTYSQSVCILSIIGCRNSFISINDCSDSTIWGLGIQSVLKSWH